MKEDTNFVFCFLSFVFLSFFFECSLLFFFSVFCFLFLWLLKQLRLSPFMYAKSLGSDPRHDRSMIVVVILRLK